MSASNMTNEKTTPIGIQQPITLFQQLWLEIRSDPLSHLPSLFFLGMSLFGLLTLFAFIISDWLTLPFIMIATLASLYAFWHLHLLGSLKEKLEEFRQENEQFSENNQQLKGNINQLEHTLEQLKGNNDYLHQELQGLQNLRQRLQAFADDQQRDFSQLLSDANKMYARLEHITTANEQALLQRIAQDLEFLDRQSGMQKHEYERFIQRIPIHLQTAFIALGDTSFQTVAGDNDLIEYQELEPLLKKILRA